MVGGTGGPLAITAATEKTNRNNNKYYRCSKQVPFFNLIPISFLVYSALSPSIWATNNPKPYISLSKK